MGGFNIQAFLPQLMASLNQWGVGGTGAPGQDFSGLITGANPVFQPPGDFAFPQTFGNPANFDQRFLEMLGANQVPLAGNDINWQRFAGGTNPNGTFNPQYLENSVNALRLMSPDLQNSFFGGQPSPVSPVGGPPPGGPPPGGFVGNGGPGFDFQVPINTEGDDGSGDGNGGGGGGGGGIPVPPGTPPPPQNQPPPQNFGPFSPPFPFPGVPGNPSPGFPLPPGFTNDYSNFFGPPNQNQNPWPGGFFAPGGFPSAPWGGDAPSPDEAAGAVPLRDMNFGFLDVMRRLMPGLAPGAARFMDMMMPLMSPGGGVTTPEALQIFNQNLGGFNTPFTPTGNMVNDLMAQISQQGGPTGPFAQPFYNSLSGQGPEGMIRQMLAGQAGGNPVLDQLQNSIPGALDLSNRFSGGAAGLLPGLLGAAQGGLEGNPLAFPVQQTGQTAGGVFGGLFDPSRSQQGSNFLGQSGPERFLNSIFAFGPPGQQGDISDRQGLEGLQGFLTNQSRRGVGGAFDLLEGLDRFGLSSLLDREAQSLVDGGNQIPLPRRVGSPGIQGDVQTQIRNMLGGGGLSPDFVDASIRQVLEPAQDQLIGRMNQLGGGAFNLGTSGAARKQLLDQSADFMDDLTRTGFSNFSRALDQGAGLGNQLFGQGLANTNLLQDAQRFNAGQSLRDLDMLRSIQGQGFNQRLGQAGQMANIGLGGAGQAGDFFSRIMQNALAPVGMANQMASTMGNLQLGGLGGLSSNFSNILNSVGGLQGNLANQGQGFFNTGLQGGIGLDQNNLNRLLQSQQGMFSPALLGQGIGNQQINPLLQTIGLGQNQQQMQQQLALQQIQNMLGFSTGAQNFGTNMTNIGGSILNSMLGNEAQRNIIHDQNRGQAGQAIFNAIAALMGGI